MAKQKKQKSGQDRQLHASSANQSDFGKGIIVGILIAVVAVAAAGLWLNSDEVGDTRVDLGSTNELVEQLLEESESMKQSGNSVSAIDLLQRALRDHDELKPTKGAKAAGRRRVLHSIGELYSFRKKHGKAYDYHRQAHGILLRDKTQQDVAELAISYVTLATDLYLSFQFDKALRMAAEAMQKYRLPPTANAVILKLESTIYECKGDFISSLQRLEQAFKIKPPANHEEIQRHLDLIKRVRENENAPTEIDQMMGAEQKRLESLLVEQGPFESKWQLPKHFTPGLRAEPWHEVSESDLTRKSAAYLELQTNGLLEEYRKLKTEKKLMREQECIHSMNGGSWSRYEITGIWQPLNQSTGCSIDTPFACEIMLHLRQSGLRVIRAGYSVVDSKAWLKPHHGMSNAQLKFHLGLSIPGGNDPATQCAFFRVTNQTKGWSDGRVIYFDDSFEHEVRNDCDTERVVFQVVFVHPDVAGRPSYK